MGDNNGFDSKNPPQNMAAKPATADANPSQPSAQKNTPLPPPEPLTSVFQMGPDFTPSLDLRRCRPYFLIPLLTPQEKLIIQPEKTEASSMDATSSAFWRTVKYIKTESQQKRFTDVFIVSHGWHRNFYGAVSAYDRLVSRMLLLWRTNRLRTEAQEDAGTPPEKFVPLFLTLHWHSDPGENGWVDKSGRRHKASFLQNVAEVFKEEPQNIQGAIIGGRSRINDFEEIYELMAQMSSPSQDALTDAQINGRVTQLTQRLFDYRLKNAENAENAEKVAVAWMCYHEAEAKGVLLSQDQKPNRVLSFQQAVGTLVKFAVSALGIAFVIGKVISPKAFSGIMDWLVNYILTPLARCSDGRLLKEAPLPGILQQNGLLALALLAALSAIMYFGVARWHREWQKRFPRAARSVPDMPPEELSEREKQRAKMRNEGVLWQCFLLLSSVCSSFVYLSGGYYALLDPVRHTARLTIQWCRSAWHSIPLLNQIHVPGELWSHIQSSGWLPTQYGTALYLYAATISAAYLLFSGLRRQMAASPLAANGLPILLVFTWLLLELPILLPVVTFLLLSYLFGGVFVNLAFRARRSGNQGKRLPSLGFLFDERLGKRNQAPGNERGIPRRALPRLWLGKAVRWPIFYLQQAIAEDSSVATLLDTLDSQLAFYEMQYRGVQVGAQAADFVARLYEECRQELRPYEKDVSRPRLHLLGHSFGALTVANAARHLVLDKPLVGDKSNKNVSSHSPQIDSLSLLQGALASDWFEGEQKICDNIGLLSFVYSGYDTANGFLYPAVNRGRMAGGSVGMFLPDDTYTEAAKIIQTPCYASLVRPPDVSSLLSLTKADEVNRLLALRYSRFVPLALNVDASRLIYSGAIATGGGHDDIFKDDVVHLLWGMLRLTWLKYTPPSPNTAPSPPLLSDSHSAKQALHSTSLRPS